MKVVLLFCGALILSFSLSFAPDLARATAGESTGESKSADEAVEAMEFQNTIADCNRIKPLQNPRYERSSKILERRIIDSKSKVIGSVKDILFSRKNGHVRSLYVDLDRLNLGQSIYLNYNTLNIESVSTGYQVGFNSDEMKILYPALLSGIETVSGDTNDSPNSVISLEKVLGSEVISSSGLILGNLEDILFDSNGKYVRSVYLNINYQTIHDKGVAIPLSILAFEEKSGETKVLIDEAYVKPILEMAKES